MARSKSNISATSTDKKPVEAAEITTNEEIKQNETPSVVVEEPKTKVNKNFVTVKNPKYAYRKARAIITVYEFDEEGKANVSKEDAEAFIKCGFEVIK